MSVADYINNINENNRKINETLNEISSSLNINSKIVSILEFSKLQENILLSIQNHEKSGSTTQSYYNHGWGARSCNYDHVSNNH